MPLVMNSGPVVEPITLDDAKSFLRVDGTEEDILISSLITSARIHVEILLEKRLITQSWSLLLDRFPDKEQIELPLSPLQSVDQIQLFDVNSVATTMNANDYEVDHISTPPRLVRKNQNWPQPGKTVNGIEIIMSVGYGNAVEDIPEPIRQAIRLLVTHWYENREPVAFETNAIEVPETVLSLLHAYRAIHL